MIAQALVRLDAAVRRPIGYYLRQLITSTGFKMEVNDITNKINDLKQRSLSLRGYL